MFQVEFATDGLTTQHLFELDFTSDLPNLIDGSYMFAGVGRFINFRRDEEGNPVRLDKLEDGYFMFENTDGINYFTKIDMPNLKTARYMFYPPSCSEIECHLENWCGNLDSLEDGSEMFLCIPDNFYSNLPKLKKAFAMNPARFKFRGTLQSLEGARSMFYNGSLDSVSVLCIVSSIPDRTGLTNIDGFSGQGYIDIGIDCADDDESKNAFAQEIDYDTWDELIQDFTDKNWNVRFIFRPQTSSYSMRGGVAQSPVYVKLEEMIMPSEEDLKDRTKRIRKPHYAYTSADGSKFYNFHTYHVSNTSHEGYTLFNSLGEAIEHYGLIRKEESAN